MMYPILPSTPVELVTALCDKHLQCMCQTLGDSMVEFHFTDGSRFYLKSSGPINIYRKEEIE